MRVVFLDTETTGLHPHLGHEVWEIGMIIDDTENLFRGDPEEILLRVIPDLSHADPGAIRINNFYEVAETVRSGVDGVPDSTGAAWTSSEVAAFNVAKNLSGAIIVGNNPAFDEMMLADFCRRNGQVLANFHRKINVVDMALGYLHHVLSTVPDEVEDEQVQLIRETVRLPHSSHKVLDVAGCPPNEAVHTALGDARHVRSAYLHLTGAL